MGPRSGWLVDWFGGSVGVEGRAVLPGTVCQPQVKLCRRRYSLMAADVGFRPCWPLVRPVNLNPGVKLCHFGGVQPA